MFCKQLSQICTFKNFYETHTKHMHMIEVSDVNLMLFSLTEICQKVHLQP